MFPSFKEQQWLTYYVSPKSVGGHLGMPKTTRDGTRCWAFEKPVPKMGAGLPIIIINIT